MNLGEVLVVGAKKNGDLALLKELESITNSNLASRKKKKNSRRRKSSKKHKNAKRRTNLKFKSKDTNLCNSCENYECLNRRPYKTSCSSYRRCKTSRFKTFKGNHGNTGSGSRIYRA